MLDIFYVDLDPANASHGITTYTSQYTSVINNNHNLQLTFIWLNSKREHSCKTSLAGISHYFVPRFNEANNHNLTSSEWIENIFLDLIKDKNPIIHINWIGHIDIFKRLRWRVAFKIVYLKHCIPWRDYITDDYSKFKIIDNCLNAGTKPSTINGILANESSSYRYVDHIVTVTEMARNNLIKLFSIDSAKISVIYNGINYNKTFPKHDGNLNNLRLKYGFLKEHKLLLFVGTVSIRKGVSDLIEAFRLLLQSPNAKDIRLIIVGSGDYSLLFKYPTIVSKIIITGNLSKKVLSDFYQMADVGIIPSYVEQCSYSAIEMMLSKLPVIAANVDGLKEIITDDFGTRVQLLQPLDGTPSIDLLELKESVDFVLNNKNKAKKKALLAYQNAKIQFSLPTMIKNINKVYHMVQEKKSPDLYLKNPGNQPKVTVLIPVFNAEKFISECINSVLNQTYFNFELILINDASNDSTLQIIKGFTDDRIKVLSNKVNKGVSACLNFGLLHSNGEYIARIDSDDVMLPNRLHEQVSFMECNREYGMVGSWYEVINSASKVLNVNTPFTEHADLTFLLLFANQFAHPTTLIRSSILKSLKYTNLYKHCEDYDLWFRISAEHKVGNLPLILTRYRLHSENISNKFSTLQKKNSIKLVVEQLHKMNLVLNTEEIIIQGAIMMKLGISYFTKKNNLLTLHDWIDKIMTSPSVQKDYDKHKREELKRYVIGTCCK